MNNFSQSALDIAEILVPQAIEDVATKLRAHWHSVALWQKFDKSLVETDHIKPVAEAIEYDWQTRFSEFSNYTPSVSFSRFKAWFVNHKTWLTWSYSGNYGFTFTGSGINESNLEATVSKLVPVPPDEWIDGMFVWHFGFNVDTQEDGYRVGSDESEPEDMSADWWKR
jgi:hypothetical protein